MVLDRMQNGKEATGAPTGFVSLQCFPATPAVVVEVDHWLEATTEVAIPVEATEGYIIVTNTEHDHQQAHRQARAHINATAADRHSPCIGLTSAQMHACLPVSRAAWMP